MPTLYINSRDLVIVTCHLQAGFNLLPASCKKGELLATASSLFYVEVALEGSMLFPIYARVNQRLCTVLPLRGSLLLN